MYSAYKLNKQGDNIQPWCTPYYIVAVIIAGWVPQKQILGWNVYAAVAAAKSLQSCPTLCDPVDGSPLGPAVPGILQAKTLEWVAISSSNAWKWKWKWSRSVGSDS